MEKQDQNQHDYSDSDWLQKVDSLINSRLSDPHFSVDLLVAESSLCRNLFFKKMKRATGHSPNQHIQEMRLQVAMRLLQKRECQSVRELSQKVGFYKPDYFARLFKARFGQPPSVFLK